jgi:hypothetical protein
LSDSRTVEIRFRYTCTPQTIQHLAKVQRSNSGFLLFSFLFFFQWSVEWKSYFDFGDTKLLIISFSHCRTLWDGSTFLINIQNFTNLLMETYDKALKIYTSRPRRYLEAAHIFSLVFLYIHSQPITYFHCPLLYSTLALFGKNMDGKKRLRR